MSYLSEAIGYLNLSLKYGSIFFCFLYAFVIRKMKKTTVNIVIYYIFVIYIFTVLAVTGVIGKHNWTINAGAFAAFSFSEVFSLEKLLNVIMFLPLGLFLPYMDKKTRWHIYIIIGFLSSLAIECIQCFFVGRLADVADVFANVIGCILGISIFEYLHKKYLMYCTQKKIGIGSFTILFNLIMFIVSMPLIMQKLCLGDLFVGKLFNYKYTWSYCDIHCMEFSGIHYTLIYILLLSLASFQICNKHLDDLFSNIGRKTSIIFLTYLIILLFYQMI